MKFAIRSHKYCNVARLNIQVALLDGIKYIVDAVYTAFLFTKSDIKTTLIPIASRRHTFFAVATAPMTDFARLPNVIMWIRVHLLQFDVSNQTMDPDEDILNKGYRPIPAKRITLANAIILRWLLVPICFAISLAYSVQTLYASFALVGLTVLYDELGAHASNFIVRNVVNACGFMAFESGATLVAGTDRHRLHTVAVLAICLSGGIFATTIQSQDFKDEAGDRKIGRQTIPIVFPMIARYTVLVPLIMWSFGLSHLWQLDLLSACIFSSLAVVVGISFIEAETVKEKQVAFYWYNVWLSVAHALPGYYHLFRTMA
ncbi:hypothetical protein BDN70DRAFT_915057 [Pholiota conissans]|uniref:Uncharacterized protein n=1 Tax=Pholiota conissans TaxID=109636 RepID=A0A9P5YTD7_9AGAR|nr:hypothetical protein BDN70DRAFT_915057 [Pholiota conissans]